MDDRSMPAARRAGFTLIEVLIGVAIVTILAAIAVPAYLDLVQRAREATVIQYLREVHSGQMGWRLETDAPGFTGDFDELEETGFVPAATNFVRVRVRAARRGTARESSSRLVQSYRLDLQAQSNPTAGTYTYSVRAYPVDRNGRVRWFYLDHTGVIRVGRGWAGPGASPLS